ncbi:MAG: aminotransferase class I/II-fold pyridoxal phosphate-dependent enzyme [Aquisalimonadaceae bacterium]
MRNTPLLSETDAFDLHAAQLRGKKLAFRERLAAGAAQALAIAAPDRPVWMRCVLGADGREVELIDPDTQLPRKYLNFGSNNYLGLTSHPVVLRKVREAVECYGSGTPGSSLLNGYSRVHRELEERLARLKGKEAAVLFSSGYAANVGIVSALLTDADVAVFDQLAHASLWDGLKLSGASRNRRFRHNDAQDLDLVLEEETGVRDKFVAVEGIYSMDGDAAPLDAIVPVCKKHGAILILDDAHATGVMGEGGHGSAEHFGVEKDIDVVMGTLGKALGAIGAFAAGERDLVEYLRFFARSYIFSTALPPAVVGAALGALDVMEREPEHRLHLTAMIRRATEGLAPFGLMTRPAGCIIALRAPEWLDARRAVRLFERAGLFMNYVMFPAVPVAQQRLRISISAWHTEADVDRLIAVVDEVWATCRMEAHPPAVAGI